MQKKYNSKRTYKRRPRAVFYVMIGVLIAAIGTATFLIIKTTTDQPGAGPGSSAAQASPGAGGMQSAGTPAESQTPAPVPSLGADLVPYPTDGTAQGKANTYPSALQFKTDIMEGDSAVELYAREPGISFGSGDEYTELEGVITFRGNNYRDAPSWGIADITDEKLTSFLTKQTSSLGGWTGSAWTGQPLAVKWPDKTRQNMTTLYDKFRNKEGFTEIILASVDGRVYFMDADTGEKTRDQINLGAQTKGTASLDPRGYPLLFVGQGLDASGKKDVCNDMYYRAVNLIDGTVTKLWGFVNGDPFAYRGWQAYDSSALIDAKTDTLIEPGENGVVYTMKLNTDYDEDAGTLTIDPDPIVKYRYTTPANQSRDERAGGRWGVENSAAAWRNYLFFTDNAGMLQCLDLNTMKLVYANDLGNDSDVSMVLEEDLVNQDFYLYNGDEYDDDVANAEPGTGPCYARKIDGLTGEIIWEQEFTCDSSNTRVDGGILATPILGKEGTSIAGLIIYNICDEVKGSSTTSELVAMDKLTGDIRWRYDMDVPGWSPSSPVPVYTEDGRAYIVQCDRDGNIALIKADGQSASAVDKLPLKITDSEGKVTVQNNFEATPVVINDMIVVASRNGYVFFIKIS